MPLISSEEIKNIASSVGFDACGISQIDSLEQDFSFFRQWLSQNAHAGMHYMENYQDKRYNPKLLMPEAKSMISVLLSYHTEIPVENANVKVSKHALGKDYHHLVKEKLYAFIHILKEKYPQFEGIPYCDTAPVMDRAWAAKAGLGWIGKNTCLINEKHGSFCVIGEILCNAESSYDKAVENRCGDCTLCLQKCPNQALEKPFFLNANKCTAYHTIENKSETLPENINLKNYILGCDECQLTCPWNAKACFGNSETYFSPSEDLKQILSENSASFVEKSTFKKITKGTAFSRLRYEQFLRNLQKANTK